MIVEADDLRPRKCASHQDRRPPMAAADVRSLGALFQLGADAPKGRQPLIDEVGRVARAKEPLGAAEETGAVLVPADALAALEGGQHGLVIPDVGLRHIESAEHAYRA